MKSSIFTVGECKPPAGLSNDAYLKGYFLIVPKYSRKIVHPLLQQVGREWWRVFIKRTVAESGCARQKSLKRVRFLSRIESSTREKYTGETMYDFPLLFSLPFFFFTCIIYFRKIFSALYSFQQVVGNTFIRNKRHVFFYSHNSIYNSSSKI